jgi:hypothetical protein
MTRKSCQSSVRVATTGTLARSSRVLGHWRRYAHQVITRSWFDTAPDRVPYLQSVVAEARDVVPADVLAALAASIRRDPARQHEEAMIAHGRTALLEGRWRQAAAVFMQLLRTGEPRTRAVAAFGLLCAGSRTDMSRRSARWVAIPCLPVDIWPTIPRLQGASRPDLSFNEATIGASEVTRKRSLRPPMDVRRCAMYRARRLLI